MLNPPPPPIIVGALSPPPGSEEEALFRHSSPSRPPPPPPDSPLPTPVPPLHLLLHTPCSFGLCSQAISVPAESGASVCNCILTSGWAGTLTSLCLLKHIYIYISRRGKKGARERGQEGSYNHSVRWFPSQTVVLKAVQLVGGCRSRKAARWRDGRINYSSVLGMSYVVFLSSFWRRCSRLSPRLSVWYNLSTATYDCRSKAPAVVLLLMFLFTAVRRRVARGRGQEGRWGGGVVGGWKEERGGQWLSL